jgi:hypothetical protein
MPTKIADIDEKEFTSRFQFSSRATQDIGRHFKIETLARSEGYYVGCDSNDDLPYYTASNPEDRNLRSHRSEAQTRMRLLLNPTIPSLNCDL